MKRRDALRFAASGGIAVGGLVPGTRWAEADEPMPNFIDTNVSLFHWPFRHLPLAAPQRLAAKLRSLGITQAWAGSFEGLLHRDLAEVNRRLAENCRKYAEFIPIGSINPTLPGWEDDLRVCIDEHGMPGVRLHPNYHGYSLGEPVFETLLRQATDQGLFVQIAVAMEDHRTQSSLVSVSDVGLTVLTELMPRVPGVRVQLLNLRMRSSSIEPLARLPGLYFDTARIDATDGVARLVEMVSIEKVLLGTHSPFLIPEAGLVRLHESGHLGSQQMHRIASANATHFLHARQP
jgi:predicted TIM-barrel fold metal-dependent hydrolase